MNVCALLPALVWPCSGSQLDFGSDAGLALDISKKLVVVCNQYDVTTGGDTGDKKAEILMPGLITSCIEALAPCGSTLKMRIRETGSDEDIWHIRSVEGCGIPCGCACPCIAVSSATSLLLLRMKPLPFLKLIIASLRVFPLSLPPCVTQCSNPVSLSPWL
jgi:hypothetical protein